MFPIPLYFGTAEPRSLVAGADEGLPLSCNAVRISLIPGLSSARSFWAPYGCRIADKGVAKPPGK